MGLTLTTLPRATAVPPQAEDMMSILQQIRDVVLGTQQEVEDIQAELEDSKTVVYTDFLFTQLDSADRVECTSDAPFKVHLNSHVSGTGDTIQYNRSSGNISFALGITVVEDGEMEFGANPDDVVSFAGSGDSTNHVSAMVWMETSQGATAGCESS